MRECPSDPVGHDPAEAGPRFIPGARPVVFYHLFYYREGASNEQIRWMPSLTDDEIALLKDYIQGHFEEVVQAEQEIKAYHDRKRAEQPDWTRKNDHLSLEERWTRLREKLAQRQE